MKQFFFPAFIWCMAAALFWAPGGPALYAQQPQSDPIDSLLQNGRHFYQNGQYKRAIQQYQVVLALAPASVQANYQMAQAQLGARQYAHALEFSNEALHYARGPQAPIIAIKGQALEKMGRPAEAESLYKNHIQQFGGHFLLYYQLGSLAYTRAQYQQAKEYLEQSVALNYRYSNSHWLLGNTMEKLGQRVPSLLSRYFFLLLEPDSKRGQSTYQQVRAQMTDRVTQTGPNNMTIDLTKEETQGPFGKANLMISMLEASKNMPKNQGKTELELFGQHTQALLSTLARQQQNQAQTIWWQFYVRFFGALLQAGHGTTMMYFISMSHSPEAMNWLRSHPEEVQAMARWINRY